MRGVLASGAPLEGTRRWRPRIQGCGCRLRELPSPQRLGQTEGRIIIPPITGQYLFHARMRESDEVDLPYVENARQSRSVHRCHAGAGHPRGHRFRGQAARLPDAALCARATPTWPP